MREIAPPLAAKRRAMAARLSGGGDLTQLTARETAVAELAATGLSDQAIGKTLHVAEVTAKKALHSVYRKLGVSNRTALTRIMLEGKKGQKRIRSGSIEKDQPTLPCKVGWFLLWKGGISRPGTDWPRRGGGLWQKSRQ